MYYKLTLSFCTTHYQKLGVLPSDKIDIIKAAYIKLAKLHHPDVNQQENETKFKEITNAYNILKDPIKRQLYDQSINQPSKNQYSNKTRDSPYNTGWQYNGEQQRQWQDYNCKQTYKTHSYSRKAQTSGSSFIYVVLALGGIFILILSLFPEQSHYKQKHLKVTNANPTSYVELKKIYDSLEDLNQPQRYLTHIEEENQTELRRQNVIYQSQNINDSPFVVNQRRKMMKEEMKQKQFKIESETYEKVIKGNSKMLKRKQKSTPQKGELKTKHGDLTLEGFANQQKLVIQKSINEQSTQPTQLSIEHLEQGYM